MTTPLVRQTSGGCRHSWRDPERDRTWYITNDHGATFSLVRMVEGLEPSPQLEVRNDEVAPHLWLMQTAFCSPLLWWRRLEELRCHPDAVLIPMFFHLGQFVIGPGFQVNGRVCPTCVALRLAQAFPHPQVFTALLSSQMTGQIVAPLDSEEDLLDRERLSHFVRSSRERLLAGDLAAFSFGDQGPALQWHRILPPPGEHIFHSLEGRIVPLFVASNVSTGWTAEVPEALNRGNQSLVDAFVGPLLRTTRVPEEKDEPVGLHGYVTVTGSLGRFTRWHPDVSGSGLGFVKEQARLASIGEAVERYSGNYIPLDRLVLSTTQELTQQDRPHLPFERFLWCTEEQCSAGSWPLATHTPQDSIPWIAGHLLGDPEQEVLLPAEIACLSLNRVTRQKSRISVPLAGIAAHTSLRQAQTAALLELIERDSTMLFWHGGLPARRLVDLPKELLEQLEVGTSQTIEQWFLLLTTDMPVFSVAGCLYDREHALLVIGFAARATLANALQKAIAEAWQLRRLSLSLLNRESSLWCDIRSGALPMPARPYRSDRRYQEEFQADFGDMTQLTYNLQYFLDPSTHAPALARLTGRLCAYQEAEAELTPTSTDVLADCVARLNLLGEAAYSVDLSTPDMQALAGFTTVRVICPGFVGNFPTAFVPYAHPRMQRVLREQGTQAYLAPMPHA